MARRRPDRQVAARARHGSVVQRHVARQHLVAGWPRCSGAFAARWMVGCADGSQVAGGSLQLWIVSYLGSLPHVLAPPSPVMGRRLSVRSGWTIAPLTTPLLPCYLGARVLRGDVRAVPEAGAGRRPDR